MSNNLVVKRKICKNVDNSICVTPKLYDRLSKFLVLPCKRNDSFESHSKLECNLSSANSPNHLVASKKQNCEVKVEPRTEERKIFLNDSNWILNYAKKAKKERIVWQSKLFKDTTEVDEKPLFKQTEELIDTAADHFSVWLKQMDDESNINKEFVKQLFAINVESDASKALCIKSTKISSIPHAVSKAVAIPEKSIQNCMIKIMEDDKKLRNRRPRKIAFMRCLPKDIRKKKFDEESSDHLYQYNCPKSLSTLQTVFDSILHLRSTQALVEHLKKYPEMPRAKYLKDCGMFSTKNAGKAQKKLNESLWTYFD